MWNGNSQNKLTGIDPRLIQVLELARERSGIPFEISEGKRDEERQRKLVAEGKSQTMKSRHLHGSAVDVFIPDGEGGANWDFEAYRPIADAAKAVAAELGYNDLVWGGDWDTLKDGVHFQIGEGGNALTAMPQEQTAPVGQLMERPQERHQERRMMPRLAMQDPAAFQMQVNPLAPSPFEAGGNYLTRYL